MNISYDRKNNLVDFAKKFNLNFNDFDNLNSAFIHPSYANFIKKDNLFSYERLEFLGDAILKFLISDYFYTKFPDVDEGILTEKRNSVVSDNSFAIFAKKIAYFDLILFSPETKVSKINFDIVEACVFEALIGAIYLELGISKCREFIFSNFTSEIDLIAKLAHDTNYRGILQDYTQKIDSSLPNYELIEESGEPHNKIFKYQVSWNKRILGIATASTKKQAMMLASKEAIENLKLWGEL